MEIGSDLTIFSIDLLPAPKDVFFKGDRVAKHVSVLGDSLVAQFECEAGFLVISSYEDLFGDPWGFAGGLFVSYVTPGLVIEECAELILFDYYEEYGDGMNPYDEFGMLTPTSSSICDIAVGPGGRMTFRMKSGPKVFVEIRDTPRRGRFAWLGILGRRCGPKVFEPRRMKIRRSFLPIMPK